MRLLTLKPFQRFEWQSEKYGADLVFRLSSLITIIFIIAIGVSGYELGQSSFLQTSENSNIFVIGVVSFLILGFHYFIHKIYFALHQETSTGEEILDFQYGLNQWFTLILTALISLDFFYFRLDSYIFIVLIVTSLIYFLARLFGTLLIFQDKNNYPILTVFIYLCTFEIAPALVIAKVLFVNA